MNNPSVVIGIRQLKWFFSTLCGDSNNALFPFGRKMHTCFGSARGGEICGHVSASFDAKVRYFNALMHIERTVLLMGKFLLFD